MNQMELVYSNTEIKVKPLPKKNPYGKPMSGIRFYGCNPTLLSLFLVKSMEELQQSMVYASITRPPSIMDYWDKYGHDWGVTHVRRMFWNLQMTEITILTHDYDWEEHQYLQIVAERIACENYSKVTFLKTTVDRLTPRCEIHLYRNSMTQVSTSIIGEVFSMRSARQLDSLIIKYLSL